MRGTKLEKLRKRLRARKHVDSSICDLCRENGERSARHAYQLLRLWDPEQQIYQEMGLCRPHLRMTLKDFGDRAEAF